MSARMRDAVVMQAVKYQAALTSNAYVWVRGIVRRQALDRRRKRNRHGFVDQELIEIIDHQFEQIMDERAAMKQQDEENALYKCMSKLKPAARNLVLKFYRDHNTHEELGRLFHKSVNAIRLALTRVRQVLRKCVKRQLAEMEIES